MYNYEKTISYPHRGRLVTISADELSIGIVNYCVHIVDLATQKVVHRHGTIRGALTDERMKLFRMQANTIISNYIKTKKKPKPQQNDVPFPEVAPTRSTFSPYNVISESEVAAANKHLQDVGITQYKYDSQGNLVVFKNLAP